MQHKAKPKGGGAEDKPSPFQLHLGTESHRWCELLSP